MSVKTLICSVLMCCFASTCLFAQEDLDWAGLNTHLYEFREVVTTPAPKGYKPVYLSHYGRHGARTGLKNSVQYDKLISLLQKADSIRILTAEGDSLLDEVRYVRAVYDDMEGRLLPSGQQEQHRLAGQIYSLYPDIFAKGRVRVETSTVPRSIVSGTCFIQTLSSLRPDITLTFDTGEKYMKYINNSPSGEHDKVCKPILDSLKKAGRLDGKEIFGRLFKDSGKASEIITDPDEFQELIYVAARNAKASGLKTDPFRHLPREALLRRWGNEVKYVYMRHGNSLEYGDDRMTRTEPLARVILSQARQAVISGNVDADLKFGHDYPLLALVSYFGLDGVGDRLGWNDLPDGWSDSDVIPYSSNLQMVIYGKKDAELLVKFVYNGRERSLRGLEPVSGPYYKWDDVYARFIPQCDERTFVLSEWNWQDIGGGAQSGYAQMNIFDSPQSISVVRYPSSSFKTCIANEFGKQADKTSALADRYGGVAAINGSYFNMRALSPVTFTVDDGKVEGHTTQGELSRVDGVVAIRKHRFVDIISVSDTADYSALTKDYREILSSGPLLLRDGRQARECWPDSPFYTMRHPRTIVGTAADGWVYFVVIDGRFKQEAAGATINEAAEIARMFGLKDALNLDGGGSSTLWTEQSGVISHPSDNHKFDHSGQRTVPNIIYIKH